MGKKPRQRKKKVWSWGLVPWPESDPDWIIGIDPSIEYLGMTLLAVKGKDLIYKDHVSGTFTGKDEDRLYEIETFVRFNVGQLVVTHNTENLLAVIEKPSFVNTKIMKDPTDIIRLGFAYGRITGALDDIIEQYNWFIHWSGVWASLWTNWRSEKLRRAQANMIFNFTFPNPHTADAALLAYTYFEQYKVRKMAEKAP